MKKQKISDEEFFRKYEAHQYEMEKESLEKSLPAFMGNETINHFINRRQLLKEAELKKLKHEAKKLFRRLQEIQHERIREEVRCFKDITFLHKKLTEDDKKRLLSQNSVGFHFSI